ncbi:hypothetical protein [Fimbriiglobus ruber]|uniref:Uncharacterized protein n=1 Tax=Fimbriiglobus ruber TaxID=1908690 RepID=A0A225DWS8_9BACT|nr:hypothetical protein [Fimbriiglobus ruber]OWK44034.1 hypothetical protein FRUB_03633 [Fimbriiglobus ruber]
MRVLTSTTFSLLLLLSACDRPNCPGIYVKQWSPGEQDQIRTALDQLPANSILVPAIEDYERLRLEAQATQ